MTENFEKHIVKIQLKDDSNHELCKSLIMERLQDYITEVVAPVDLSENEYHDDDLTQSLAHAISEPAQIVYSYDQIMEKGYNEQFSR